MNHTDFLDELGELALGSRLKRLAERMANEAGQVYQTFDMLPLQPKWFVLAALLYRKGQASVVEASERLGLSQPAISQFAKGMAKEGLIDIQPCGKDSRRKFMVLSDEGRAMIEQMQPAWQAVDMAAKQLCSEAGHEFFQALQNFEQALSRRSLAERTGAILTNPGINPEVSVVSFRPELAQHFETINTEWISDMFKLEPCDVEMLQNPEDIIINHGGEIYFAEHPTFGVIGTCALLNKGQGCFELTKMGVLKKARGLKIGETLLAHVIEQAKQMQVENLFLLTNSACEAAIHLYEKFGFEHDKDTMERFGAKYERCDVAMRFFDREA